MPSVVRIATSEASSSDDHHRALDPGARGEVGLEPQEGEGAAGEARAAA